MAPGLPLPGQTVITSGAVPEDSWVRICCWYWSAPLVVKFTLTPGLAASNALTTSSMEPWSTEARVRVLESLPDPALVPPLQAVTSDATSHRGHEGRRSAWVHDVSSVEGRRSFTDGRLSARCCGADGVAAGRQPQGCPDGRRLDPENPRPVRRGGVAFAHAFRVGRGDLQCGGAAGWHRGVHGDPAVGDGPSAGDSPAGGLLLGPGPGEPAARQWAQQKFAVRHRLGRLVDAGDAAVQPVADAAQAVVVE